jgi:hypothetical protein
MEEIKKAILNTTAGTLSYRISFISVIACFSLYFIFSRLNWGAYIFLFLLLASLLSRPVIQRILWNKLDPDGAFRRSEAYRSLDELGCVDEFLDTIDKEMNGDIIIRYFDDIKKANLFVTKTWFVLITSRGSVIRKVSDISKVRIDLMINRSRHAVYFEFIDGKHFSTEDACDEIFELFEQKFPELVREPPED